MFAVIYYILLVILLVIYLIITLLVWPLTVPFERTRRAVHEISRSIALLFFRLPPAWHTTVRGLEHVDRSKAYVIVLNHSAMTDIPMLYWVPLNFRWVSKSELRKMPFFGQFLMLHGDILIDRKNPRKAASMVMDLGCMWLKDRRVSIAIFPEGTRSKTGEMGAFKASAFALAKEAGVGVLPVVLKGSRLPLNIPWRHDFSVTVLPPVSAEEVAAREPREVMDETRRRMMEVRTINN